MISIIAAIGKNGELGRDGKLIFHLPEDMKFFKETTMGHKIVMGRRTWESLPAKLPGRENIVVSRRKVEGADETVEDLEEFLKKMRDSDEEIFIIGGGMLYAAALPYAKRFYLTEVNVEIDADTWFPIFDKRNYEKKMVKEGKSNDLSYQINVYELKNR